MTAERAPGRAGRGKLISRANWPDTGKLRDWLELCAKLHQAADTPSLRQLAPEVHLRASQLGVLLRGKLPADERQARDLLRALKAEPDEVEKGIGLYQEARAEQDQAERDAVQRGGWLRSGYAEQVRDIAPRHLEEREDELGELAAWCTRGDEAYAWWQAGPKAGKTALMAWFVLHPPPGVTVISFFVSANQAHSSEFTEGLLHQLAAITRDPIPTSASAREQDWLRRELLERATAMEVRAGRRLVLVVDGLDEDRGSAPGSRCPSIAACLPRNPPTGLRVVVASRPDPPLPGDVQDDHPLRQGQPRCRIRPLTVSPHATYTTRVAQRELDEALAAHQDHPGDLRYQVLGLVTACGAGLGHRDLQQLTSKPAGAIDLLLNSAFGRIIAGRADPQSQARVFLFTHGTLREHAIGYLGADEIARFAASLHAWATGYQRKGWPADTPAYLLRGYPRLLADAGDLDRLVALATDPARHQRMLDATGGDAAALAEITAAGPLVSTSQSPDLLAALRLAWYRDQLTDRNTHIPAGLPAVWATLGQPTRAEALARSITDPGAQARALAGVAAAAGRGGDLDRAEQVARSITDPGAQARALAGVAAAASGGGDLDRAEQIARSITYPYEQARVLAEVVAARAGDLDRAEQVARTSSPDEQARALDRAEKVAWSITNPYEQARALAGVAEAVGAGDLDRAGALAAAAEQVARSITKPDEQARAKAGVAAAAAGRAGDLDRAEQIARSITKPDEQARALAWVAEAAGRAGDLDRAERVARSITSPYEQAWAMARVASVAEPARARSCIAGALAVERWVIPLKELAHIDPAAVLAFADEQTAFHGLPGQLGTSPQGGWHGEADHHSDRGRPRQGAVLRHRERGVGRPERRAP